MHVTNFGRNIQGTYFALPLRIESPHPPVNPATEPVLGDTATYQIGEASRLKE
jgi:hypothetical protein